MEPSTSIDPQRQGLIFNVVHFLQDEVQQGSLNEERKELVEVAIQCLETAFELDADARTRLESKRVDLLSIIPKVEVISDERKNQAEICKTKGNTHMKSTEYSEAVAEYTKAIELNPTNAVYYCNRAAAYSRLERHLDAISDCQEAIKLDAAYGKAYGRLGIAYSNLNKFEEARSAYVKALQYDPGNAMYETNLKLAEERLFANMESAAPPEHRPLDINQFINNPNLMNMAAQMLGDPGFRNVVMQMMSMGESGDPRFNTLFQVGQHMAQSMEVSEMVDPEFVDRLRRTFDPQNNSGSSGEASNQPNAEPPKDSDKKSD